MEWIPNRVMSTVCSGVNPPYKHASMSGTSLLNSTSITTSFQRILSNFEKMFNRKAYVHWYTNEGMDENEFYEAQENIRDLISEYQQYSEAKLNPEDDDEIEFAYEK